MMATVEHSTQRIRKVGDLWHLSRHGMVVAKSSNWNMLMWIATADPAYRQPGRMLMPDLRTYTTSTEPM